jgi:cyclophilin family peptidyl-prolyl cis-trans isomerase
MNAASPLVSLIMSLFSVILPTKMWFGSTQPITVRVDSKAPLSFVMTRFDGTPITGKTVTDAPSGNATADLRTLYPDLNAPGTYVLFAVPKGKSDAHDFVGTPAVIEVRLNKETGVVDGVKIEPLRYVVMTTEAGPMTMVFYYDAAPNTVDAFLRLSSEGYYDGLTFHRIMPTFMLQGGDPVGNGSGGPGFNQTAEFNDHKHEAGVLSMARQGDPGEQTGAMPGPAAANSAGSQFFICLDYKATKQLDGRYTVFGKVVDGTDTMNKLKSTPLQANGETPINPPVINKAEVFAVTHDHNPYAAVGLGK